MNVVCKTNLGPIRGILKKTADNFKYYLFQGIPYVVQPNGKLKFKDPQPLKIKWTDALDCTKPGSQSYSYELFRKGTPVVGGENALFINVFTPELKPQKLLPVMVWIHGGGYFSGTSSTDMYGPDYLIEHNIIVVSFNYRFGVMGFLNFPDSSFNVPGNAGLKDQHLALKWVKENIEYFGGDSNNITLTGESAGASSVHYQCLSPKSKGLFHRAIMISGSVYSPWAFSLPHSKNAIKLARKMGYTDTSVANRDIFDFLNEKDPKDVVRNSMEMVTARNIEIDHTCWTPFSPTVDSSFIEKTPLELGREAWSNEIDLIIGGCADEGLLHSRFVKTDIIDAFKSDPKCFIPAEIRDNNPSLDPTEIKEAYYGSSQPSMSNLDAFLSMKTDSDFFLGFHRTILQRLQHTNKTYLFRLATQPGASSIYKRMREGVQVPHLRGTAHSDSLPLLFKTKYSDKPHRDERLYPTFLKFLSVFTQFVKNGNPNDIPNLDETWRPVTKSNPLLSMNITEEQWKMQDLPQKERLEAFARLYPQDKLF